MRVAFLGNHTVGVRSLLALSRTEEVVGVVAHPPDPENGVRYQSVHDAAVARGWKTVRGKGNDPEVADFLRAARPDLLWIADYRYLLPEKVLNSAPLGAVNLHPSLLPKYRGRAPINWAILNGEKTLGLTAHRVDSGMDTGDVLAQESFSLQTEQDVGDALEMLYPIYERLTLRVAAAFRAGSLSPRPQDHAQATVYPRRRPDDGCVDWAKSSPEVRDLIRAVAAPYPGAFTTWDGHRLMIWKAEALEQTGGSEAPGTVLASGPNAIDVRCGDGVLRMKRFDLPARPDPAIPVAGTRLGC